MKKSKWFVVENTWFRRELPESMQLEFGWGNGYVAVHRTHPLFGKEYNKPLQPDVDGESLDCIVNVHGGITYSRIDTRSDLNRITIDENGNEVPFNVENPEDWWVFGFDTGHYMDNITNWPKEAVIEETKRFEQELNKFDHEILPQAEYKRLLEELNKRRNKNG